MPFESQFFHDDGDDGYDGGPAMEHGDEDDLWQGTQGLELKKARPDNVHFAKKAKRVDVKRLKDDIWTGLRGLVPEPLADSMESDEEVSSARPPYTATDPSDATTRYPRTRQDVRFDHSESSNNVPPGEDVGDINVILLHLSAPFGQRRRAED